MRNNIYLLTIIIVVSFLMLVGCTRVNVARYNNIDQSLKSITVPPGADGLKGALKRALSENGWNLMVDRGPSVAEGNLEKDVKIKQYDTFNTRYRLYVSFKQFDRCINSGPLLTDANPAINFDISFIDNKTGAEVFTMAGRGCQADVIEEFTKAIKEAKIVKD